MYKPLLYLFFALFVFSCAKDKITDKSSHRDSNFSGLSNGSGILDSSFGSSGGVGSSGGTGSSGGSSGSGDTTTIEAGQITAGEWNDLDNWDFWLDLLQNQEHDQYDSYWGIHLNDRYAFQLEDISGKALRDATISAYDAAGEQLWISRSDNHGLAYSFTGPIDSVGQVIDQVTVTYNGEDFEFNNLNGEGLNQLTVPIYAADQYIADIQFIVDATGSMGDELEYLKVELNDVIENVTTGKPYLNIRTSAVYYRDQGDDYITKVSPFSYDVNNTISFIAAQSAGGGGDFPEAVDMGLMDGIMQSDWSEQAITRLAFLVLDAPPHHESEVIENLYEVIEAAAMKGIKIIPVTASGIDKSTEFLMRFLAIASNGTYCFITDHSGIGGDHLEPTTGEYEVEFLNDLLERLINKYSELN